MEWISSWFLDLQQLGFWGYWLILLVTFGESFVVTGLFTPGTIVLVIMGGLVPHGFYDIRALAFFAIAGAILGETASYELGRLGRLHVDRIALVRKTLGKAKEFFLRHKGKSILLARFIGPIRPVVPFVAGALDMKRPQFYAFNILSALIWCPVYLAFGYGFGLAWKRALAWSSASVAVMITTIIVVMLLAWMARWFLQRRKIIASDDVVE